MNLLPSVPVSFFRAWTMLLLSVALSGMLPAQPQLPHTLSPAEKVYGLSKFWQEANYNFVYINKVDRGKWEQDYQQLITEVQATESDYAYYRLLQQFCATLEDGHTNVYFPKSTDSLIYTTWFGDYRLILDNIEGKAMVTHVNQSKKDEIPIGTEITKVNGLPTRAYADQFVKPYIASSTDYILESSTIAQLLRSPIGTTYQLELKKPNGELMDLEVTHGDITDTEIYPPYEQRDLLDFKWINDEIAYVSLNSFAYEKIDTLFIEKLPEIRKAKKLIVDLRYNGGGSTGVGTAILQYLTHDQELYGSAYQSRLHIPAFKAWGKWTTPQDTVNVSEEDKKWNKQALLTYQDSYFHKFPYHATKLDLATEERIVIPTVLLIGNGTASAAEDFLIAADNQKHMIKIGQPTFGSTGQPMVFDMPGGGSARICTKKDTYPDGREFVGVGIQPDIYVKKSLDDFIHDKDPALEKAIEYLENP
ncbi:MAG: S41 family peptidase [Bacteroidota bacterium]